MDDKRICAASEKCRFRSICFHSVVHKETDTCIPTMKMFFCGFKVQCNEHKLGATGEELLCGLFPVVKSDIT